MTIVSMILLGILIYINISGIFVLFKSERRVMNELGDINDNNYKNIGCFSGCFGMIMYIPALLITAFCVGNSLGVVLLVSVIVGEFIEGNIRIRFTNKAKDKDDYLKYILRERHKLFYVLFEIYELIVFIYVFFELFLKI
ncbi:hypothetical protein [Liquorilactobacillus hordei]|uniref:hypothetical protein n=1 Tax=Liquorilactobacillus hordei TaxID=468911 RepID=UPI0039EB3077